MKKKENVSTLTKEQEFCDDLAAAWSSPGNPLTMRITPTFDPVDRICFRAGDVAVCALEVKCFKNSAADYVRWGSVYMDVHKFQALLGYSNIGLIAIFAIRLSDGDYWCVIGDKLKPAITIKGRTDRGEPDDIQPCVHLLWSEFRLVK